MTDDRRYTERDLILARREGWTRHYRTSGCAHGESYRDTPLAWCRLCNDDAADRQYPFPVEPTRVTLRGVEWTYQTQTDPVRPWWGYNATPQHRTRTWCGAAGHPSPMTNDPWTAAELRAIADCIERFHAQAGAPPEPTP